MEHAQCYTDFAKVYDQFMEGTPYQQWVTYIEGIWGNPKEVLDLGCGTGTITLSLAQKGYDMIGVDLSTEMLMVAREKCQTAGVDVLFLNQDMSELELYGTVDAVICLCDSLNYVLEEEQVQQTFHLVHNYLVPDGLFIFDLNTCHKYRNIMADNTFAMSFDCGAYIWENHFDLKTNLNEYAMDFFVETTQGLYQRFEEVHMQRAYPIENICKWLTEAGFAVLHVYDDGTLNTATEESQRVHVVAQAIKLTEERGIL